MLKVLGSMLILLASVGFGFQIQMDLRNHLRLLYDIRKLLLDIANETAYTMDPMEVVLEHAIHSRNPYLNEICKEMGEGLQKKERGCGQELWQERIEAWQKRLGLSLEEKEIFAGAGCAFFGKSMGENEKSLEHYLERLDYVIDQVRGEQKEKPESVSDRQCDVWADHHSSVFVKAPKAVERQELYECKFDF